MKKTKSKKTTLEERVKKLEAARDSLDVLSYYKKIMEDHNKALKERIKTPMPDPSSPYDPVCPTCGRRCQSIFYTTLGDTKC